MRGPGREWYEKNEEGVAYKLLEAFETQLGWNHKQFLDQKLSAMTLLDIGCGRGGFLHEAVKRGYQACGVDFDRINVEVAKNRLGISEVFAESLEEFILHKPGKRFDVVTFFEVLEHVPDPRKFLAMVRSVLKPGGYMALSVPNRKRFINTIAYLDKPPYHLTRWTMKSIETLLSLEGFDILCLRVKPLQSDDLVDIFRLGVGRRLIRIGRDTCQEGLISLASKLYGLKRRLLSTVTIPIAWGLRSVGCQGVGLYCLAKARNQ
jgi:SAM-dependent methyltransferase